MTRPEASTQGGDALLHKLTDDGSSCLLFACRQGHGEVVELLLAGQVLLHGAPVGGAHVTGGGDDLGLGGVQLGPKVLERGPTLAWPHPEHAPAVQVDDQRDILRLGTQVEFVNGDALHVLERHLRIAHLQVGLHDVLDRVPAQVGEEHVSTTMGAFLQGLGCWVFVTYFTAELWHVDATDGSLPEVRKLPKECGHIND
jgi:hypothetical protein